jgi:hypothetical protein
MPLDQEEWRDVIGAAGYRVSNSGCVISFWHRTKPFPGATFDKWRWAINLDAPPRVMSAKCRDGYSVVSMRRHGKFKMEFVHLLVLEAFIGPRPEGLQGRHLNDDKSNNRLSNLAWGTPSQNMRERHVNAKKPIYKLSPDGAATVRERLLAGESQSSVARSLGVHQSLVSRINSGKRWNVLAYQEVTPCLLR